MIPQRRRLVLPADPNEYGLLRGLGAELIIDALAPGNRTDDNLRVVQLVDVAYRNDPVTIAGGTNNFLRRGGTLDPALLWNGYRPAILVQAVGVDITLRTAIPQPCSVATLYHFNTAANFSVDQGFYQGASDGPSGVIFNPGSGFVMSAYGGAFANSAFGQSGSTTRILRVDIYNGATSKIRRGSSVSANINAFGNALAAGTTKLFRSNAVTGLDTRINTAWVAMQAYFRRELDAEATARLWSWCQKHYGGVSQ